MYSVSLFAIMISLITVINYLLSYTIETDYYRLLQGQQTSFALHFRLFICCIQMLNVNGCIFCYFSNVSDFNL